MNKENVKLVLAEIKTHPANWDQRQLHKRTKHCFAGWGQIMSGATVSKHGCWKQARIFFGFSYRETCWAFSPCRTLEELETLLYERDTKGYDRDGYDIEGFNRAGYARDGLCSERLVMWRDENGFDEDGYDINGYDSDGYDRDGLNLNNTR